MGKFYKNISGTYTIHRDLRNGILCLPNFTYIPKHTNPSLAILEYVEGFLEEDTKIGRGIDLREHLHDKYYNTGITTFCT